MLRQSAIQWDELSLSGPESASPLVLADTDSEVDSDFDTNSAYLEFQIGP